MAELQSFLIYKITNPVEFNWQELLRGMGLESTVTTSALLGPLSQLPQLPLSLSELCFLYLQQEETDLGLGLTQLEIKIVGTPRQQERDTCD